MVKQVNIIRSKKSLEIALSKVKGFKKAQAKIEQYATEANIAAEMLWNALYKGLIEGKVIVDMGCGTGMLGIGCLLLGAKKVYFVDIDKDALDMCQSNIEMMKSEGYRLNEAAIMLKDVSDIGDFEEKIDFIVENPPFGVKSEHADRIFLMKAFELADDIYSFHKSESKRFIEAISLDNGFFIVEHFEFKFPLKQTMKFHTRKIKYIDVGCWHLKRR